jgi:hypothetical protein
MSILILSSHLSIGLPSGLFPSSFSTKMFYANWYEHILRITIDRLPKIILNYKLREHRSIEGHTPLEVGNMQMTYILQEEE